MVATLYGVIEDAGDSGGDDAAGARDDDDDSAAAFAGGIEFEGLVALNAAGHVVWYYELGDSADLGAAADPTAITVFEFLPGHEVALLAGNDAAGSSSQLLTVDARTGAIAQQHVVSCDGDASHYNALSHELRVDPGASGERLLTTAYVVKTYDDGVAVPSFGAQLNQSTYAETKYTSFLGGTISVWDRESNALATECDLCFDSRGRRG